jgi:anti-anti-sigma factor
MDLERTSDHVAAAAQWLHIDIVMSPDGRHTQVNLDGELDATTAGALTHAIGQVLHASAPELVELQVAALTFLDAAGIRCLLTCLNATKDAESRLILLDPSPEVNRVLDITGLLELFGLSPQPTPDDHPGGAPAGCPPGTAPWPADG